jgi:hypothetical protein
VKRLLILLAAVMMYSLPSLAAWTRVRFQTNYCGDSVASCTFTVPATTAGRLLVVAMMYDGDTVNVSSASGAGTWTHPSSCKGSFSGGSGVDWIYNLSSTSGATSITVNLSATASFVDYWYYEYTGTAPFTFDVCGVNNGSSSTSAPAGSVTTSGANGLAIAGVKGDQTFAASTTVTATGSNPWTSPTTLVSAFEAMAEALNFAATTTQPLFTVSPATNSVGSTIAFQDSATGGGGGGGTGTRAKRVFAMWLRTDGGAIGGGSTGGGGGSDPPPPPPPSGGTDFMLQIAHDEFSSGTTLAFNEGNPHGVPSDWDFYSSAILTDGNNPCASVTPCSTTMAMTYWGTVYADKNGNPATNTRVQIKGCRSYWLNSSTHAWTLTGPDDNPDDEDYPEDFSSGATTANKRTESDGSLSIKLASGKTNHFFGPFPRITFPRAQFGGVVNYCQMRLIVDNAGGTDDRASAKIIANVGGDFYPSATGAGIENNPGIGGGKMKYVTSAWRSFAFTSLPYTTLTANPPPLDLTGLNP